jgi:murein DD-endopeptidase MepM/ murein hydrolase activator NlpD
MILNLYFGRYQMAIKTSRRPGRPRKTTLQKLQEYFNQLLRLAKDRRYSNHPLNRVLRRVFEAKNVRQFFGLNLLAITLFTGVISPSISAFSPGETTEITSINPQIIQLTTQNSVRWPVEEVRITQGYHQFHKAIDLAEPVGSPVYPIMDGVVESISYQRFGYGNHIIIDHGSGFKSLYAHFSKIVVKKDQEVDKNTVIGLIGATGWATGPHLHLEVYDNGQPFNPLTILK